MILCNLHGLNEIVHPVYNKIGGNSIRFIHNFVVIRFFTWDFDMVIYIQHNLIENKRKLRLIRFFEPPVPFGYKSEITAPYSGASVAKIFSDFGLKCIRKYGKFNHFLTVLKGF